MFLSVLATIGSHRCCTQTETTFEAMVALHVEGGRRRGDDANLARKYHDKNWKPSLFPWERQLEWKSRKEERKKCQVAFRVIVIAVSYLIKHRIPIRSMRMKIARREEWRNILLLDSDGEFIYGRCDWCLWIIVSMSDWSPSLNHFWLFLQPCECITRPQGKY